MANDGKIYITISDRRFGKNKAEADEQNNIDKKENNKESALKDFAKHKFFNFIQSEAKQIAQYSINNIGNFTGDYFKQNQISNSLSVLNSIGDIAVAGYSGFTIGGVPGAIISTVIATAGKAVTAVEQLMSVEIAVKKQNYAINMLRTRSGLNSTNNGSRGTDY